MTVLHCSHSCSHTLTLQYVTRSASFSFLENILFLPFVHSLLPLNQSWLHLGSSHNGCISKLYFPIPATENLDTVFSVCTVRSCYGKHCPGGWGVSYSPFTFLVHSRESVMSQTFIIRVTNEWIGRDNLKSLSCWKPGAPKGILHPEAGYAADLPDLTLLLGIAHSHLSALRIFSALE